MDHLAKAVISAFAFLELSEDDVVNPHDAVRVMGSMTADLRECNNAERKALEDAVRAQLVEEKRLGGSAEVTQFLEGFIDNLFADE